MNKELLAAIKAKQTERAKQVKQAKQAKQAEQAEQLERIIRLKELCKITGLSRTSIWRRSKDDSGFPPSFRVSVNVVGWKLSDVTSWINSLQLNGGI